MKNLKRILSIAIMFLVCGQIYAYSHKYMCFPGGENAFVEYLKLKIPNWALGSFGSGKACCSFKINDDGNVYDFRILSKTRPGFDHAITCAFIDIPQWIPSTKKENMLKDSIVLCVDFINDDFYTMDSISIKADYNIVKLPNREEGKHEKKVRTCIYPNNKKLKRSQVLYAMDDGIKIKEKLETLKSLIEGIKQGRKTVKDWRKFINKTNIHFKKSNFEGEFTDSVSSDSCIIISSYNPDVKESLTYGDVTVIATDLPKQDVTIVYPFNSSLKRGFEMTQEFIDANKETDNALKDLNHGLGYCHAHWRFLKKTLLEKYGLYWMTPSEMRPYIIYD